MTQNIGTIFADASTAMAVRCNIYSLTVIFFCTFHCPPKPEPRPESSKNKYHCENQNYRSTIYINVEAVSFDNSSNARVFGADHGVTQLPISLTSTSIQKPRSAN